MINQRGKDVSDSSIHSDGCSGGELEMTESRSHLKKRTDSESDTSRCKSDNEFIMKIKKPSGGVFHNDEYSQERSRNHNRKVYIDGKFKDRRYESSDPKLNFFSYMDVEKMEKIDPFKVSNDLLHTSPQGDPCRFIPIDELAPIVLNPKKYLQPGEIGINTILQHFNPLDKEKTKYFVHDYSPFVTDLDQIIKMTTESLYEQLEWVEKELEIFPEDDTNSFVVVSSIDHTLQSSLASKVDVNDLDWDSIAGITNFDVILMDPPWPITMHHFAQVVGGLDYQTMSTEEIASMPIPKIQKDGYCFMWVIMSCYPQALKMMELWGYELLGFSQWIKMGQTGSFTSSPGFYMRHGKETLIVGRKGRAPDCQNLEYFQDLIYHKRNPRQSHKPEIMYEIIEKMFPNCMYIEIFARSHNLREGWYSVGTQVK